jgi:putative DNA primase/helicase
MEQFDELDFPALISHCIQANELGDGQMFATLNRGRYVLNRNSGEWLLWSGHHWAIDKDGAGALIAVESVSARYLDEARRLVDEIANTKETQKLNSLCEYQKTIYKRVNKLRSDRGRKNCLQFAHTSEYGLSISGDQLDTEPWSLPCRNGVINLKTGELEPGRPEDYLMVAAPTQWQGISAPCPVWEQMLLDCQDGNSDMVSYLRRLFGYAITGLHREHILPVFWGQGRNGKGTIIETLKSVLGLELAAPVQAEMLLDQAFARSSSGPSPDIMALKGVRLAFASETDDGRRISPARVKWLTGGDTLKARNPHDRYETSFVPSHTLFLLTNHKPHAPSDDFAFWERLHLIPFPISFVSRIPRQDNERRADEELEDKLRSEYAGILSWLVRGCLEWQQDGLDPPPLVREATAGYRRDEDMLADFIDECCLTDSESRVTATALYNAFTTWFETNYGKRIPSQKRFGSLMAKKFERRKDGIYFYYGITLPSGR